VDGVPLRLLVAEMDEEGETDDDAVSLGETERDALLLAVIEALCTGWGGREGHTRQQLSRRTEGGVAKRLLQRDRGKAAACTHRRDGAAGGL
jgi:hypothetical protein